MRMLQLPQCRFRWKKQAGFGIVIADENKKIMDFEEKPKEPRSNLASMGIYIFSWKVLKRMHYRTERSAKL